MAERPKLLVRDAIPAELFRYFSKEEYARQFLAGQVRMVDLKSYAKSSDPTRADELEGRGEFRFRGMVVSGVFPQDGKGEPRQLPPRMGYMNVSSIDSTPYYVLCLSKANTDRLRRKWGGFVVRIGATGQFLNSLHDACGLRSEFSGPLECGSINYASSPILSREPTHEDFITQACFTKTLNYECESEFRLLHRATKFRSAMDDASFLKPVVVDVSGSAQSMDLSLLPEVTSDPTVDSDPQCLND